MGKTKRSLHVVSTRSLRDEAPTTEQEQNSFSVDMEASSSSVRKRGRAKCVEIQRLQPGLTAPLVFNNNSQPISTNTEKFGSFLGMLARTLVPINIKDWKEVKADVKEGILKHVEEKFSYEISREDFKRYVYSKVGTYAKNYRSGLRRLLNYDLSVQANYKRKPDQLDVQQWQDFVQFSLSTEGRDRSTHSKQSRSCQGLLHNTRKHSFAKRCHTERDELGNELRPLEFFQRTHTAKKGVNVEAARVLEIAIKKLHDKIGESGDLSQNDLHLLEREVLDETLGPEHSGCVRGFGFGPTKSSLRRSQAETSEVVELKKEVLELKQLREEDRQAIRKMQEQLELILSSQVNGSGRTEPQAGRTDLQASCS